MSVDEATEALQQAEQESSEADALVRELEQRLKDGDQTVTAEQLDDQHRLSRWAKLRAEGAARKRAEAQRAAAVQSARAAVDQVADITTSDAELVDAWTDAVDALRQLATIAVGRTEIINRNQNLLEAHDSKLHSVGAGSIADHGVKPARFGGEKGYQIPDRGIHVAGVPTSTIVATVVEAALRGVLPASELAQVTPQANRQLVDSTLTGRIVGWNDAAKAAHGSGGPQ